MKENNLKIVFAFVAICLSGINPLIAQEKSTQTLPGINGHTFVPISIISIPFTNSYFKSTLGVAQSFSTQFPLFELDGETVIGETGSILFANLGFQYQQRIKDWIAFNGSLTINTRIGTDIQSIIGHGINSVAGYQLQWILRIIEKEKYMLSGSFHVSNLSGSLISISGYILDIINDNPNPSISKSITAINTGTGLRFAYGFNDLFGLILVGDIRYGEALSRVDAGFTYKIGGTFDVNLADKTTVPMGFALSFLNSTAPENVFNELKSTSIFNFKIAYTGSPDFILGLETSYLQVPLTVIDAKANVVGFLITTRYYFN